MLAPTAIAPDETMPATLQPIEAGIATAYRTRLEGLFQPEALGLHAGRPHKGSFLARIGKSDFWTCSLCKKDQICYSPAVHFYIQSLFPENAAMSFRDYCQVWGQSFFTTRHDLNSARDILLLFLDQNLRYLKRLYILEQPHNQDLAPTRQDVERCFDAPANGTLFVGDHFSRWLLEDWLPFHLRYVCCREFLAHEEMLARESPRTALEEATLTSC